MKPTFFALVCLAFLSCQHAPKKPPSKKVQIDTLQGQSLLGESLVNEQLKPMDEKKVANYKRALAAYQNDSLNADHHIWLGRRLAYLGDYRKAITTYTKALKRFPGDARFYRHRGHRYISIRQLDKAIQDLEKGVNLIEDTEDVVEPDGIPNRLNQPVSSLHTNIYYHLGLAHYLQANWPKAQEHFQNCVNASTNDDMRVAASHWLYMILKRMAKEVEAQKILEPIHAQMEIIENDAYHRLLLFYKGDLEENALVGNEASGTSEAVRYGVAHWYQYHGNLERAKTLYKALLEDGHWPAFGYIAAEAEMARLKQ